MGPNKPLSPCVQSAMRSLPESATSWEMVKYLLGIHPEYRTKEMQAVATTLDQSFNGERKNIEVWLEEIAQKYPREHLLHSGLVIVGLCYTDPALKEAVPQEAVTSIENRLTLN